MGNCNLIKKKKVSSLLAHFLFTKMHMKWNQDSVRNSRVPESHKTTRLLPVICSITYNLFTLIQELLIEFISGRITKIMPHVLECSIFVLELKGHKDSWTKKEKKKKEKEKLW